MRISVGKNLLFVSLLLFLLAALFGAENGLQDPSPAPSPSPSASPSPSPKPVATPTPLPGAQNFHQWGSITVFNGLPSDSVRAIAQTNDGVMWFGTDNGLARFDGRRIQDFSPGDADGSKSILALAVSSSGDLWIGTRGGLFGYANNRFRPVDGTQDFGITKILDVGEELILGTDAGLILKYRKMNDGSQSAVPAFNEPIKANGGSVVSITGLVLNNNRIIASTSGRGLLMFEDTLIEPPLKSPASSVHAMVQTSDANVWLGTGATKGSSGVYRTDGTTSVRIAAPTADVYSLEANDSGIWAGTERYGLFHFADGKLKKNYTFENTSGGLRSNTVYALFTDREGVLWIGTNRGVSRFDRLGAEQRTVSDSPNSNFVRILAWSARDGMLAGTNRGLFRQEKDVWRPFAGFDNKVIYAVSENKGGERLIGSATGLFDGAGRQIAAGDFRAFTGFQGSTYAAVYGRGVMKLSNGEAGPLVSNDQTTTTICPGRDRLWIGTTGNGLFSYDGNSVKLEIAPEALKSGTIWKIANAVDGSMWIAGQHGVFHIVDGQVAQIDKTEDVRDVIVIGDTAWAATTTRGLLHIRRDDRFNWLVSAFGFEQGLPSEKAFSIMPIEDGLLIATNRGVVTYKPDNIAPKIIPTRVLSQRAHDLAELDGKIDLEYPQNALLVEVAGQSSRTFPEEFQYAFVLTNGKGEEVARQLSNDPQYAPSELKPGEYTIEAVAFNRDLLPSDPLFIRFSIAKAPFPWTATALGILLALAVVGLVWAIVEHRRIAQRNRELAAARFDLANEAERERRRIARDLHDQTLADLRNLMLLSDRISPDKPEFRSEIESVSSEIRRICEDLSPSVLENVGLIAALEFLLKRTVEKSEFHAEENLEDRISLPMNAQLQTYRIAQEVLTNIKRHSTADHVAMTVSMKGTKKLQLIIRDNGEHFDANGRNATGRGIANIKARASLIHARISWSKENENGNRFSLEVDA